MQSPQTSLASPWEFVLHARASRSTCLQEHLSQGKDRRSAYLWAPVIGRSHLVLPGPPGMKVCLSCPHCCPLDCWAVRRQEYLSLAPLLKGRQPALCGPRWHALALGPGVGHLLLDLWTWTGRLVGLVPRGHSEAGRALSSPVGWVAGGSLLGCCGSQHSVRTGCAHQYDQSWWMQSSSRSRCSQRGCGQRQGGRRGLSQEGSGQWFEGGGWDVSMGSRHLSRGFHGLGGHWWWQLLPGSLSCGLEHKGFHQGDPGCDQHLKQIQRDIFKLVSCFYAVHTEIKWMCFSFLRGRWDKTLTLTTKTGFQLSNPICTGQDHSHHQHTDPPLHPFFFYPEVQPIAQPPATQLLPTLLIANLHG